MTRKVYQQAEDKAREREIAQRVADAWHCEAVEFPALSPIDWYMKRENKLVGLIEIKTHRNRIAEYRTVLLDVLKTMHLMYAALAFNVKAVFVVQFTDGLYYVDVARLCGLPTAVRGRTDRGDRFDVHPCIEIPRDRFTEIATTGETL